MWFNHCTLFSKGERQQTFVGDTFVASKSTDEKSRENEELCLRVEFQHQLTDWQNAVEEAAVWNSFLGCYFFHASEFVCTHTGPKKKKEKKKDSQCFSCMCGVFCAGRADANGNMHVCCVSFIDVSYIYTLCFVLNSLKQLVLNLLKATTTEWEHGLAYVEKTLFLLYSWLFTCLGAQCHHVSVTFLPELI